MPNAATQAWNRPVASKSPGVQAWTSDANARAITTYTAALTTVAAAGVPEMGSPTCLTASGTSMVTDSAAEALIAPRSVKSPSGSSQNPYPSGWTNRLMRSRFTDQPSCRMVLTLSQWANSTGHRTKRSLPGGRLGHAVIAAADRDHELDVLPGQLVCGQSTVSALDQARMLVPRDHAAIHVGPRIPQKCLGLVVEFFDAAVVADPADAAQGVFGAFELVVLGSDPDGDRIIRCLVGSFPAHRADGHLVDLDAERLVPLERPDRLLPLRRVPLL